jgi:hypothetical protein
VNIQLESDDYRKLVELAFLGEWLINAQHDDEHQDDDAERVLGSLLSAGPMDGVDKDEETGEYFISTEWVERLYDEYILDYDDHVFWDELTERLAARDLADIRGTSIESVNRDDDLLELKPLEERYREELEAHGVERLHLTRDF